MTFRPGQSGNPRGRPRRDRNVTNLAYAIDRNVTDLARAHAPHAIEALVQALYDRKQRVAAAIALLERAYGKPVQPVDASLSSLSDETLISELAQIRTLLGVNN